MPTGPRRFGIAYRTSHGFDRSQTYAIILVSNLLSVIAIWFGNASQGALFAAPAPFIASWLTSLGFGTVPVFIFWAAVIVAALVNIDTMHEGRTLEGDVQNFGGGKLGR